MNGWNGGDILPTQLTIYSDNITKADAQLIPTGEIVLVENTPFGLSKYRKTIGEGIHVLVDDTDVNYVLGQPGQWHKRQKPFDSFRHSSALLYRQGRTVAVYGQYFG